MSQGKLCVKELTAEEFEPKIAGFFTELRSPQWLWEYVSQVVCPSLLVHGMESDILAAEVAEKVGHILAFGSVVDIEYAGHSVPGDNPDAFEAAVRRFLSIGRPFAV